MVHTMNGDFPRTPIERIAHKLLDSARQDPALLGRRHAPFNDATVDRLLELPIGSRALRPLELLAAAPFEAERQLENLVSIAVTSAQQAEDACQEARVASRAARRGVAVMAGVGTLGVLVGIAAIADQHLRGNANQAVASAEISNTAVPVAPPLPQPPPSDAAGTAGNTPESPQPVTTAGSNLLIPAASAEPVTRVIVPPVYHGPVSGHATPWPTGRQVNYTASAPTGHRVVVPRIFVSLRRDIGALLRGGIPHS
jgi:hypothetical protein